MHFKSATIRPKSHGKWTSGCKLRTSLLPRKTQKNKEKQNNLMSICSCNRSNIWLIPLDHVTYCQSFTFSLVLYIVLFYTRFVYYAHFNFLAQRTGLVMFNLYTGCPRKKKNRTLIAPSIWRSYLHGVLTIFTYSDRW